MLILKRSQAKNGFADNHSQLQNHDKLESGANMTEKDTPSSNEKNKESRSEDTGEEKSQDTWAWFRERFLEEFKNLPFVVLLGAPLSLSIALPRLFDWIFYLKPEFVTCVGLVFKVILFAYAFGPLLFLVGYLWFNGRLYTVIGRIHPRRLKSNRIIINRYRNPNSGACAGHSTGYILADKIRSAYQCLILLFAVIIGFISLLALPLNPALDHLKTFRQNESTVKVARFLFDSIAMPGGPIQTSIEANSPFFPMVRDSSWLHSTALDIDAEGREAKVAGKIDGHRNAKLVVHGERVATLIHATFGHPGLREHIRSRPDSASLRRIKGGVVAILESSNGLIRQEVAERLKLAQIWTGLVFCVIFLLLILLLQVFRPAVQVNRRKNAYVLTLMVYFLLCLPLVDKIEAESLDLSSPGGVFNVLAWSPGDYYLPSVTGNTGDQGKKDGAAGGGKPGKGGPDAPDAPQVQFHLDSLALNPTINTYVLIADSNFVDLTSVLRKMESLEKGVVKVQDSLNGVLRGVILK